MKRDYHRRTGNKLNKIGSNNDIDYPIFLEKHRDQPALKVNHNQNDDEYLDVDLTKYRKERDTFLDRFSDELNTKFLYFLDQEEAYDFASTENDEFRFRYYEFLSKVIDEYLEEFESEDSELGLLEKSREDLDPFVKFFKKSLSVINDAYDLSPTRNGFEVRTSSFSGGNWFIVIVDNKNKKRYPFTSIKTDMESYPLEELYRRLFAYSYSQSSDPYDPNFDDDNIDSKSEREDFNYYRIQRDIDILSLNGDTSDYIGNEEDLVNEGLTSLQRVYAPEDIKEDPNAYFRYFNELEVIMKPRNAGLESTAVEKFLQPRTENWDIEIPEKNIDQLNEFHRLIIDGIENNESVNRFIKTVNEQMRNQAFELGKDYDLDMETVNSVNFELSLGFEETDTGYKYPQFMFKDKNGQFLSMNEAFRRLSNLSIILGVSTPRGGGKSARRDFGYTSVFDNKPQVTRKGVKNYGIVRNLRNRELKSRINQDMDTITILEALRKEKESNIVPEERTEVIVTENSEKVFEPDVKELERKLDTFKKSKKEKKKLPEKKTEKKTPIKLTKSKTPRSIRSKRRRKLNE